MADTATELYNTNKKFNTAVKSHKWERMQDTYASINQTLVCWERSLKKQSEFLQTHLTKNFKYTIKEFESFSDVAAVYQILKLRNNAAQEYFKYWVDLEGKKDKLFMAGDVTKWEIDFNDVGLTPEDVTKNKKVARMLMLPTQTNILKQMQKFFGYMNVQMLEQTEYLGIKQAKRYVRAMTELCNEHIQNYSDVNFDNQDFAELH